MKTKKQIEQIQDERWNKIKDRVEDFESELYEASFGTTAEEALALCIKAEYLFDEVLDRYELSYSNAGEPNAEKETPEGKIMIALTSCDAGNNGGMRHYEEEEAELAAGESLLPPDLYWARLRIRQARDVLEEGWQSGLEEPPVEDN